MQIKEKTKFNKAIKQNDINSIHRPMARSAILVTFRVYIRFYIMSYSLNQVFVTFRQFHRLF